MSVRNELVEKVVSSFKGLNAQERQLVRGAIASKSGDTKNILEEYRENYYYIPDNMKRWLKEKDPEFIALYDLFIAPLADYFKFKHSENQAAGRRAAKSFLKVKDVIIPLRKEIYTESANIKRKRQLSRPAGMAKRTESEAFKQTRLERLSKIRAKANKA